MLHKSLESPTVGISMLSSHESEKEDKVIPSLVDKIQTSFAKKLSKSPIFKHNSSPRAKRHLTNELSITMNRRVEKAMLKEGLVAKMNKNMSLKIQQRLTNLVHPKKFSGVNEI